MPMTKEEKQQLEETIRAFVGKPTAPPTPAKDPVNEPMIRKFCEVIGDEHPAYGSGAADTVHGELVAPPTMMQAWVLPGWEMSLGYDEPRNEEQRLHQILTNAGYTGVLGTDTEQGYTRYLKPGDLITTSTVIESISEEKATGVGVGYFIATRTTLTDQNDEEIGFITFRVFKFVPKDQPAAASSGGAEADVYVPARLKPPMGPDNGWWWDRAAKGILAIQRCKDCGALRHPPRPMCDKCQSLEWDSIESTGRGTIHSYTVLHHPMVPGYEYPITAILVDLEEGERIVSNLVDCEPSAAKIGAKVKVQFHEDDDGFKLPMFVLDQ